MTIDEFLALLKNVRRAGKGWVALCPAHPDTENSLKIDRDNGKILLKCFAGCETPQILAALNLKWTDLFENKHSEVYKNTGQDGAKVRNSKKHAKKPGKSGTPGCTDFRTGDAPQGAKGATGANLTLEELAAAKKLPTEFLRELGLREVTVQQEKSIKVPYYDQSSNEIAVRFRTSLAGANRFKWRRGDRVNLYGLWKLEEVKKARYVLFVEGESDCWTCWYHGISALGVPGKSTWRGEWAEYIKELTVYLWCEPEAFDLVERVAKDIPDLRVIYAPNGIKDPSELHLSGQDFPREMEKLLAGAVLAQDEIAVRRSAELAELAEAAKAVLELDDPLTLVEGNIRGMGYGGDTKQPMIIYLSFASRLLKMRHGTMPVHLLVKGPPSAGKSYAVQIVARLHPPEAYHVIEAGSPRVLIYDEAELKHKALIFGEADSLPSGEDNPAASAIRGLLQDGNLHYKVSEKDDNGAYHVREISKEGPTVLVTSSVKSLGEQLMTRLFVLDMTGEADQVRNALLTQAQAEIAGTSDPDPALIAFQKYLQLQAPWEVVVPFARELAEGIAPAARPRILRDFQRLLSLIKAVAVLRHKHREKDQQGRLIATVDDYRFVYSLVREMYAATVTGASENIRRTVEAVADLRDAGFKVNYSTLAKKLNVHHDLARRWAKTAINHGWLINKAEKGKMADLDLGEPLPEQVGLPDPDSLCTDCTFSASSGAEQGAKTENQKSVDKKAFADGKDDFCTDAPSLPGDLFTVLSDEEIPF